MGKVNIRFMISSDRMHAVITLIYPIGVTRMEWAKIYIKPHGEYPVVIEKQDYERGDKDEEKIAIS